MDSKGAVSEHSIAITPIGNQEEIASDPSTVVSSPVTSTGKHNEDGQPNKSEHISLLILPNPPAAIRPKQGRESQHLTSSSADHLAIPHASSTSKPIKDLPPLINQTLLLPKWKRLTISVTLLISIFLSLVGQTVLSTTTTSILNDLTPQSQSDKNEKISIWLSTSYLIAASGIQLLWGRLSDIFGRKHILLLALGLFGLGSLLCALSTSPLQLILFRGLQGIGGGALLSLTFIITNDFIFVLRDRAYHYSLIECLGVMGQGLGPVMGATLGEKWRLIFWLDLPWVCVTMLMIGVVMPKVVDEHMLKKLKSVDYIGSILVIGSCTCFLLPLIWGGTSYSWNSAAVLSTLLCTPFMFILFFLWEWKGTSLLSVRPILPLGVFKFGTVNGIMVATFCNGLSFFVVIFYSSQYQSVVRGKSEIKSAVMILPFILSLCISCLLAGQIVKRTGYCRPLILFGLALTTLGLSLMISLSPSTPTSLHIFYLCLTGFGLGHARQTVLTAAQAYLPKEMAVTTSVRTLVRLSGGTLGLALGSTIVSTYWRNGLQALNLPLTTFSQLNVNPSMIWNVTDLEDTTRSNALQGWMKGLRALFGVCATCQGTTFLLSFQLIKHHSIDGFAPSALHLTTGAQTLNNTKAVPTEIVENDKDIDLQVLETPVESLEA